MNISAFKDFLNSKEHISICQEEMESLLSNGFMRKRMSKMQIDNLNFNSSFTYKYFDPKVKEINTIAAEVVQVVAQSEISDTEIAFKGSDEESLVRILSMHLNFMSDRAKLKECDIIFESIESKDKDYYLLKNINEESFKECISEAMGDKNFCPPVLLVPFHLFMRNHSCINNLFSPERGQYKSIALDIYKEINTNNILLASENTSLGSYTIQDAGFYSVYNYTRRSIELTYFENLAIIMDLSKFRSIYVPPQGYYCSRDFPRSRL